MRLTHDTAFTAAAAAVLLLATPLAGCLDVGGGVEALELDALASSRTTAPGGTVAFPLAVGPNASNLSADELAVEVVDDGGLDVETPDPVSIGGNGTGVFLTVAVPGDADETGHTVSVRGTAGDDVGPTRDVTVEVEEPDRVVESGDTVEVDYVGRFPNGSLFSTNVDAVHESPLPQAAFYQSGGSEPLNVTVGPNASFIEGFNDGIVGVGVGHDSTFEVPPEKGYGKAMVEGTEDRITELDRNVTQDRTFNLSRQLLEDQGFINESSEEGDKVTAGEPPNEQVYNITFLNETRVELTLVVEEGDTTTVYQQWPDSAEAVFVNETTVSYYVTPTTEVGENFTYFEWWPDASAVVELTNDTIVVQHSPEVGTTYTQPNPNPRQQPTERTVVELTDESVVYEEENQHPLGGQTLVFDVTVLSAS